MGVLDCDRIRPAFAEATAAVDAAQITYDEAWANDDPYGGDYGGVVHDMAGLRRALDAAKLTRATVYEEAGGTDWNVVHTNDGHIPCLGHAACQIEDKIGLPMPEGWAERNAGYMLSD